MSYCPIGSQSDSEQGPRTSVKMSKLPICSVSFSFFFFFFLWKPHWLSFSFVSLFYFLDILCFFFFFIWSTLTLWLIYLVHQWDRRFCLCLEGFWFERKKKMYFVFIFLVFYWTTIKKLIWFNHLYSVFIFNIKKIDLNKKMNTLFNCFYFQWKQIHSLYYWKQLETSNWSVPLKLDLHLIRINENQ